jgi:immune inhibitor InhA-like protein
MRSRGLLFLLALLALGALAIPSAGLGAKQKRVGGTPTDVRFATDAELALPLVGDLAAVANSPRLTAKSDAPARRSSGLSTARLRVAAAPAPTPGEVRNWVALDDALGFYRKQFTFRGMGDKIEVWVASERRTFGGITSTATDFQDGDCRNGVRTQITDAQVQRLINEFDTNMYPKESAAFSVPPDRDGSHGLGAPFNPLGEGDNIVVLIDNVRDDNFKDLNNTQAHSYIAGFFSSTINALMDRNVMTIDAFDWLHRTGANPPHEPVPGNNCTSAPARPFLYEGVFAHEYQHLLEQYEDPNENNWINEGLSDWAQTLTGYVNPATPITTIGFDSHIQCFLGNLGTQTFANPNPRAGGPENSLTRWEDQGDGEILCDYGAAYTLMEYLHGLYGTAFMTALHRGDEVGLAGLQEALDGAGANTTAMETLRNWSLMVAVDGLIDDGARILGPYEERRFTAPTLDATINWDTAHAYDTAGAPSNGADYVRLRNAAGAYLNGGQIDSLSFQGATVLPPKPVAWTVAASPPFTPDDPALYSGFANNRDEAIVKSVAVPTGAGASLTFDALWNEELGWDFGFAQVSTDGGATYKSVACTDTTTETNPDALPTAKENVPGFTGYSGGWKAQTCSLAAYAGQTVLLAFRAFNDPSALGESAAIDPGFWVDDVKVGGTLVSDGSSLADWRSFTQVRQIPVTGYTVQIVSIAGNKITVKRLPLTGGFEVSGNANVQKYIDKKADFVGAIVMYEDPSERSDQYAPYRLTVNGVVQPGGGM